MNPDNPENSIEPQGSSQAESGLPLAEVKKKMKSLTRRSLVWTAIAVVFADKGWKWLASRRQENGIPWPMAIALKTNEEIARDLFNEHALAKEYPKSSEEDVIDNGDIGRPESENSSPWKITVSDDNWDHDMHFTMADILSLPKVEMTTELRCIEGWSRIVSWGGCRLVDFMKAHPPSSRTSGAIDFGNFATLPEYVSITTPDDDYYVGLDVTSAIHPQTLLCYEMNGKPLEPKHGAPLRLVIPTKYGIKNIKWIGALTYTDTRPDDYWADQGYDWYAGL